MKIYKAYAKVNIFLKITGTRGEYHEIISRFMKVQDLYDELSFVPKTTEKFEIIGEFNCQTEQNTIYKAYQALLEFTSSAALERLLATHSVHVNKQIPSFAGLGGGSSDAATFLKMCNEVLHLGLSKQEKFHEDLLNLSIYTPAIEISTPKVYKTYRETFFSPIDPFEAQKLKEMRSIDILNNLPIDEANDLFKPALLNYPALKENYSHGDFFSGSGSSFFKLRSNNG